MQRVTLQSLHLSPRVSLSSHLPQASGRSISLVLLTKSKKKSHPQRMQETRTLAIFVACVATTAAFVPCQLPSTRILVTLQRKLILSIVSCQISRQPHSQKCHVMLFLLSIDCIILNTSQRPNFRSSKA